MMIRFQLDT